MHKSIFSFRWQSVASWPERLNTAAPVCFSSNLDGTLRSACWVVISKKMKVMLAAHVLVYEVAHFVIKIYFHPFHPSELDHFFGCTIPCFLQGIQTEMAQKLPRWVRRFAHPPDGGFLPAGFGSRGRLGLLLAQARAVAAGWSKLSHGRHRRHATGWWTSTMPRSSGCASRSRKTWCDSRSLSLWRVWLRQGWHERLPKDWV